MTANHGVNTTLKVLDLFSGLGGFSKAFVERGHEVITIDIDRMFKPTIQADVRKLPLKKTHFDVILASPPCDEFSKDSMPWYGKDEVDIDGAMELVYATKDAIDMLEPHIWVVENVRGAVKYLNPVFGEYRQKCGSRYLWGNFPKFKCDNKKCYGKWKLPPSPMRKALRSLIPYEISLNLCLEIEKLKIWSKLI